jgi:hypothetical protein
MKYKVRVFPPQLRSEWVVEAATAEEAMEKVRQHNWISPHGELSATKIEDPQDEC